MITIGQTDGQTEEQTLVVKNLGTRFTLFGPEPKKLPLRDALTGRELALLAPGTILKVYPRTVPTLGTITTVTPNQLIDWARRYPTVVKWSAEDARRCNTRWVSVKYHRGPLDDVVGVVCLANVEERTGGGDTTTTTTEEPPKSEFDWKWVAIGGGVLAVVLIGIALAGRK